MDIISGVVVFLLTWWLVIFMVLPWGLERDENGRPTNLNLPRKLLITTGVTIIIWCIIAALISADLISFREIAERMSQESR